MNQRRLPIIIALFVALWVLLPANKAFAAACQSTGSGNWTSPATWTSCNGGYPGQTSNSDTATILAGHIVTLNANPANPINRLTVAGEFFAGANTLTISGSSGTPGLSVTGSFWGETGSVIFNNSVGTTAQTLAVTGVGNIEFNHLTINNVTLTSTGTRVINVLGNVSLSSGTFSQGATRQFVMRGLGTPQTITLSPTSNLTLGRFRVNQGTTVILPAVGSKQPTAQDVIINGAVQQTASAVSAYTRFLNLRNSANTADTYLGVDLTPVASLGSVVVKIEGQESLSCTSSGGTSTPYAGRCYYITPTNTNIQTVVTLWALTLKEEVTFPLPAVFRWNTTTFTWQELTNRSDGVVGDYSYATGTTTGFSPFLMAGSGQGPTAITLQNMNQVESAGNWVAVLFAVLVVMTGAMIWRVRRMNAA
jgi:hypothetical protein